MTERDPRSGQAHEERIRDAAVDYMQSWLDGDPDRMRYCLHHDLAKRRVRVQPRETWPYGRLQPAI
jgi:hypothetical protein